MTFFHVLVVSACFTMLLWTADPTEKIASLMKEHTKTRDTAIGKEHDDKIGEGLVYTIALALYHIPAFFFPRIILPLIVFFAFSRGIGWVGLHAVVLLVVLLRWWLLFHLAVEVRFPQIKQQILRATFFGIPSVYLWHLVSLTYHTSI